MTFPRPSRKRKPIADLEKTLENRYFLVFYGEMAILCLLWKTNFTDLWREISDRFLMKSSFTVSYVQ